MNPDRQSAYSASTEASDQPFPVMLSASQIDQEVERRVEQQTAALRQDNERLQAEIQRQQAIEVALRQQVEQLQQTIDALPVCISYVDANQRYQFVSKEYESWLECAREEILGKSLRQVIGEKAYQVVQDKIERVLAGELVTYEAAVPYQNGQRYISAMLMPDWDPHGEYVKGWYALLTDITDRKRMEQRLQVQADREYALNQVIRAIRNSLDLNTIFTTAVTEIGKLLQVDRIEICRYLPEREVWQPVAEHLSSQAASSWLNTEVYDGGNPQAVQLKQLEIVQLNQLETTQTVVGCCPSQAAAGALLLVPVHYQSQIWGCICLVKHEPSYFWQETEVNLAGVIADQLAIAIHQSELYQQVQQLNTDLEGQVQERTAQLRKALEFEAALKRITDKVRDSLDEAYILQTAVTELGNQLEVDCCDTALYNLQQQTSTICYEYIRSNDESAIGMVLHLGERFELYSQLLQGQTLQFSFLFLEEPAFRFGASRSAILACPLMDDKGVLGDMWLFKSPDAAFSDLEIRLVQQVANQCAIALRQTRLYQASQAQVEELERLNRLKDDFLSTVSHELRTPLSNIKMATELLEVQLFRHEKSPVDNAQSPRNVSPKHSSETSNTPHSPALPANVLRYLQILKDECHRETELINNLLDLARLDADVDPLMLVPITLQYWIPHLVEPFLERIRKQQQQLELQLPDSLPPLKTDPTYLGRILSELLHNACKYTPPGEQIVILAHGVDRKQSSRLQASSSSFPGLLLCVKNSGVDIPPQECDRIFDKFYRIPNNDPWKHEGTGLGLALVKKLAEQLQAKIWAESQHRELMFYLEFPGSAICETS